MLDILAPAAQIAEAAAAPYISALEMITIIVPNNKPQPNAAIGEIVQRKNYPKNSNFFKKIFICTRCANPSFKPSRTLKIN